MTPEDVFVFVMFAFVAGMILGIYLKEHDE